MHTNTSVMNASSMKTFVEFRGLPASARWFFVIQSFLHTMKSQLRIEKARATILHQERGSPAFSAQLHLEVPGPDIKAEGKGFTLMEAWQRACESIESAMKHRQTKKVLARKKANVRRMQGAA
jgi:ribosome-associated translation inhibitor RaiA